MDVRVSTRDVQQFDGDAVAVGVFSDDKELQGPAAALNEAMAGVIGRLCASGEITGAADEVTLLHTLGKIEIGCVAIVGLGARARFNTDRVRRSAAIDAAAPILFATATERLRTTSTYMRSRSRSDRSAA